MRLHVAADLDGTVAFDGRPPSGRLNSMLGTLALRQDVSLSIATARPPRVVEEWFPALSPHLGRVCCNGSIVADGRGELHRSCLDPVLVRELVRLLRTRGESFCLEYGDRFAASSPDALPWMGTEARLSLQECSPLLDGVVKVSIGTGASWARTLQQVVGDGGLVYAHATGDADVVAPGANKATGIRMLRGRDDRLIALGNDLNDRELLLEADAAILVGEGLPELDAHTHVRRVPAEGTAVAAALAVVVARMLLPRRHGFATAHV